MKRRDIAVIIVTAVVSGIFSYILANFIFGGAKAYKLTAPKIDPISSDFTQPETKYFNAQSIDPTVEIHIGGETNPDPLTDNNTP